jgi:hypothetical protein
VAVPARGARQRQNRLAPSHIDRNFGDDGVATIDLSDGDHAHSVATPSDGKIVLTGGTFAAGGPLLNRFQVSLVGSR